MLQKKDITIKYTKPVPEDENGSNGLWDLAAEIALSVGFYLLKENKLKKSIAKLFHTNVHLPLYADELGQEQIYNILTQYLEVQKND